MSFCAIKLVILLFTFFLLVNPSNQLNLDSCDRGLGVQQKDKDKVENSGTLPDSAFSASSSYDKAIVGARFGRLHSDKNGGAWCPANPLSKTTQGSEFIQIDLVDLHVITHTLTQGRYGQGKGQEYAEYYTLQYWREGMADFTEYRDTMGNKVLPGNENTYGVVDNVLNPVIIANKIRILPYSDHPRTVCMRVALKGCPFNEGVISYSIPQGKVRGAMMELMDHTFDGHEDSQTGDLRAGLGQLVDGKYGKDTFKGIKNSDDIRGYNWVGWKKRASNFVNLVFTFDKVRTFSQVIIHCNNHFTKDIQVFRQAKIYFSNEEDKFGDDRFVDFKYMPDLAIENARNVSVDLKKEHGKYVMIQLYYAAKWIMVSEIIFLSERYFEKPFQPVLSVTQVPIEGAKDPVLLTNPPFFSSSTIYPRRIPNEKLDIEIHSRDRQREDESQNVGIIIGVLLTVIMVLATGIVYVMYRSRNPDKSTPTHHNNLWTRKFQMMENSSDSCHNGYTPYSTSNSKVSLYGQPSNSSGMPTQETIYEEPANLKISRSNSKLYSSGGFLNINRKYSSDIVLSDDAATGEEDYAEPISPQQENIYAKVKDKAVLKPLPLSHYARPLSPPVRRGVSSNIIIASPISAQISPPRYVKRTTAELISPQNTLSPMSPSTVHSPNDDDRSLISNSHHYASVNVNVDLNHFYHGNLRKPARSTSIDTVAVKLNEVDRNQVEKLEKLGEGQFGEIHIGRIIVTNSMHEDNVANRLVALKSLKVNCNELARSDFEHEARILTGLNDPNLVGIIGVCFEGEGPMTMICEYLDKGDLCQFLQDHVAETSQSPEISMLSYGCLIYIASQIASGMKYLEERNFVHRDLATRNCLIDSKKNVKISDFGMSRTCYSSDYFKNQAGCLLPIRWMAWESVLMGRFTTKSDVWSFGVTLWEILTFAREQPFETLTDEKVVENLSSIYQRNCPVSVLSNPHQCPREVRDLMLECWQREEKERPSFREIHLFLQRKNLGYEPPESLG